VVLLRKLLLLSIVLIFSLALSATTIQFWHAMGGWRIDFLQSQADAFMELHPDIKVEVQYTGSYRDTLNKMIAGVQAGTAPHVVQVFEIGTQMMIDGEVAIPIEEMMEADPSFDIGKFMPQVLNYYRVNGKLYSMPFNSSNAIVFYNKTLFEKAGLNPNDPPTTFESFIDVARKLTVKDASGNVEQAGFTVSLNSWFFEQLMAAQDAPLINQNNGRTGRPTAAVFNTPEGLAIFEWWNAMSQEGTMINTKFEDWTAARNLFISQKAAMLMTSTSDVALMMESAEANGFELGSVFLPRPADSKAGGAIIGGGSLWLIDGHPEAETRAAWEFIKFMAGTEQQIEWHKATGYFPVRKDSVEKLVASGYYGDYPDHLTALLQLLLSVQSYNTNGAITGAFPEIRTVVTTAIEKMIAGEMTPAQALKYAEDGATKAIRDYNEANY
jgi:sn-glycerol 3-phosphate transport system substrate-binding protein